MGYDPIGKGSVKCYDLITSQTAYHDCSCVPCRKARFKGQVAFHSGMADYVSKWSRQRFQCLQPSVNIRREEFKNFHAHFLRSHNLRRCYATRQHSDSLFHAPRNNLRVKARRDNKLRTCPNRTLALSQSHHCTRTRQNIRALFANRTNRFLRSRRPKSNFHDIDSALKKHIGRRERIVGIVDDHHRDNTRAVDSIHDCHHAHPFSAAYPTAAIAVQ